MDMHINTNIIDKVAIKVVKNNPSSHHTNEYILLPCNFIVCANESIVKLAITNIKIYAITILLAGGKCSRMLGKNAIYETKIVAIFNIRFPVSPSA